MERSCPICGKPQKNIYTHMSRTHKLDKLQRSSWLGQNRNQKGGQRFTPYTKTKTAVETSCDRFRLLHPFTAIVAGMTGSGKTVWVQKLLEHANQVIKPPPQRIVWSYSQWQPAYNQMLDTVHGIEFVKGIPHDLDEEWFFDPKTINVIVIDDQMAETSNDKRILNLFTKGSHHRNLSVIFLSQNVYFQGKIMRTLSLNASYLVLFKNPRDKLQITTLGKQMYPGKTNHFVQKYEAAVQRPYGYLFVDLKPNTKEECRLRTNVLPNEHSPSQTGGQEDELKGVASFFERQSYLQPPELNAMQRLQEQMDAILKNPNLPPGVKIKEYGPLLNRFVSLQQQLLPNNNFTISHESPLSNLSTLIEQSQPSMAATPLQIPSTSVELSGDSGIGTASPKEPSLFQRISSKVKQSFKTPPKIEEINMTPSKSDRPSASTPITSSIEVPTEFPPTPLTSKEKPPKAPRWIRYQNVDKHPDDYEPPRRSERIRAMAKSIPGWEKY